MVRDENVEAVRAARESLITSYGGLDGWFHQLQQRDRQRSRRAEQKLKAGATAKAARKPDSGTPRKKLGAAD
jgi:hypothetical protein